MPPYIGVFDFDTTFDVSSPTGEKLTITPVLIPEKEVEPVVAPVVAPVVEPVVSFSSKVTVVESDDDDTDSTATGIIAGSVALIVLFLVAFSIYYYCRWCKKRGSGKDKKVTR